MRAQIFASAQDFLIFKRPDAPACLVLDVRLPKLSGLDLQRQLAAAECAIPIIFITGHGDFPMSVQAIKAGAVEFLTKPFRDPNLRSKSSAGESCKRCGPARWQSWCGWQKSLGISCSKE
jgi:FixJ family two-component response regulator